MALIGTVEQTRSFMKSLGFPDLRIHHAINHFDFTKTDRRILIIGPMGSGKSEFSARIYRDSEVAMRKSQIVGALTTGGGVDRRSVFYIRSKIDDKRFKDYPPDCIADSYYTYRFYSVAGAECPALYFDPLIIVGGDRLTDDPKLPNYSTRCDHHHYLPGKEYTFMALKPLAELAYGGNVKPLLKELKYLKNQMKRSELYEHFNKKFVTSANPSPMMMNALKVRCIAEKALIYLFAEENIISAGQIQYLAREIEADLAYINERLVENRKIPLTDARTAFFS